MSGLFGQEESLVEQKTSTNERLLLVEADIHRCLIVGRNSAKGDNGFSIYRVRRLTMDAQPVARADFTPKNTLAI
jgi:hypothetical protein